MKGRIQLVAAVVRDPNLRRVELSFLGFKMTESAVWIAILVYAFGRGGAAAAGIVAMILLIPPAWSLHSEPSRAIGSGATVRSSTGTSDRRWRWEE